MSDSLHCNMDKPLISVVLPVHNGEKHIKAAIESILAQTFTQFELIVIDDGSSDNSCAILREYEVRDSRVKVLSRINKGLPFTLNECVDLSSAEWIVRMDADDLSLPDRLKSQYCYVQKNPNVAVLGSAVSFIDEDGNPVCKYFPEIQDSVLRKSFPNSPFIHPSVMISKAAYKKAGKYPESMKWGGEDVVLFKRMSGYGTLHNLDVPLLQYRLVPGSMSRKPSEFRAKLRTVIEREINNPPALKEDLDELEKMVVLIDRTQESFDYNFELAKLCLWSGADKSRLIHYMIKCMAINSLSYKVWAIGFIAFFPKKMVQLAYRTIKKRRFESI